MSVETGQNPDPTKRQDMAFMFWYPDVPSPYTFLYSMYHQANPKMYAVLTSFLADAESELKHANAIDANAIFVIFISFYDVFCNLFLGYI